MSLEEIRTRRLEIDGCIQYLSKLLDERKGEIEDLKRFIKKEGSGHYLVGHREGKIKHLLPRIRDPELVKKLKMH